MRLRGPLSTLLNVGDHSREEDAEGDDRDFRRLADAEPQDEERSSGSGDREERRDDGQADTACQGEESHGETDGEAAALPSAQPTAMRDSEAAR